MRCAAMIALGILAMAPRLAAQQQEAQQYSLPEAPAFTFLGSNPAEVSRPTTARNLAVQLVNGIDASGKLQQGFAIDVAPWTLIPSLRIPLSAYQTNPADFLLANTQLSLGTVRSPGDTGSTDFAVGLRFTLWDNSDPMHDREFTDTLRKAIQDKCINNPDIENMTEELIHACAAQANKDARDHWLQDGHHWNRSSFAIAFAGGSRLEDSKVGSAHWLGWSGWAVGALPIGHSGQILAQLRYEDREDAAGAPHTKTFRYGARGFFGSATTNLFAELIGVREIDAPTGVDDSSARWSGGIEFRAADQLWLSTGLGSTFATSGQSDKVLVIAGLRWHVSNAPRFGP
jgi:hypothetical protein